MDAAFIATVAVLGVGIVLVISGTLLRNRWGINVERVNCPACGFAMPQVRRPKSMRQALWGGGTCGNCGCAMDKWGRKLQT